MHQPSALHLLGSACSFAAGMLRCCRHCNVFLWMKHLQTNTHVSTCCYCRDAALLKTMQIALASLKQLQTSTDTKLKEQVGSLRVLFCMLSGVVPLSDGLGDLHDKMQGSVQLQAAVQHLTTLAVLDYVHAGYSAFMLLAMCCP